MLLFPINSKEISGVMQSSGFAGDSLKSTHGLFAAYFQGGYVMANETTSSVLPVNRTYKSTVFILLYEDKKNLLELYNAMSGKHYTDPGLMEINTLENAIYMTIRNDVSFLIDGRLSLYEHQSTGNPNLPLRFLFYISHLYSRITRDANLYGTAKIRIPAPEFVVFYNGKEKVPERQVLKLSDLFTVDDHPVKLELEAVVLNISGKNNQKLKDACRTLREYAVYTDKIREYTEHMSLEEAVDRAIRECIEEDVLKDFLEKHRAEAREMSIFEYDQEKHMRQEREAAWQAGQEKLLENMIRKKLVKGKDPAEIAEDLEETEDHIRELIARMED